jgi:hypothetical protein
MGGYKLDSVVNRVFIVPRKRWCGPPFIARQEGGHIIYSLIIPGL